MYEVLQSRIQELMAKLAMEQAEASPDASGITLWEAEIKALQALSARRLSFNRNDFSGEGMANFCQEIEQDALSLIKILEVLKVDSLNDKQKKKIQKEFLLMMEVLHIKTGLLL